MPVITTIPSKFLFYKDPILLPVLSLAALVEQTQTDGAFDVTCVPTTHQYQMPANLEASSVFVMTAKFKQKNGVIVSKRVYAHPTPARNVTTGEDIPLITFAGPSPIFGAHKLKLHISLQPNPGVELPPIAAPAVPPTLPDPVPPTPKPKLKVKAAGDLSLFVAKQLLEFAQSKHDMCPIVAEEFAVGHTAVMPCGHLFADFAIQETFKKEPNKCPVCRLHGYPTFV
jgi:hypothetical protein